MLKRMELFNIAAVFLLITSIILIIYTMEREQEFLAHNNSIQKASVHGAAYAINLQLENKYRHVRLFLDEYSYLFLHLEKYPDDETTSENIKRRLQQRFTDFFTYTITDENGKPEMIDIESLVGEACQVDLNNFSDSIKRDHGAIHNEVFVHPQPFNYHYDIMAPLQTNGVNARIFFSSFYLNEIVDVIKTHEIPGQTLILVKQSNPGLIEATREGARDKLSRDVNLSQEERMRITAYESIPNTDWRLVNLPDADFVQEYIYGLWKEVIILLTIVALALFLLVFVLVKISEKKELER